jgi:hypothetical protein
MNWVMQDHIKIYGMDERDLPTYAPVIDARHGLQPTLDHGLTSHSILNGAA